jgi:hypothetical protein
MNTQSRHIAVVMERITLDNHWQPYKWQVAGVLPGMGSGEPARTLGRRADSLQRLYPDLEVMLHRDEAEGYYLNLTSPEPRLFVLWRLHEERADAENEAEPLLLTLSYNEAARWMDAQEKVDGVPLPGDLIPWLGEFVEQHYRPEVKKQRIRPRSFESKEGRYRGRM